MQLLTNKNKDFIGAIRTIAIVLIVLLIIISFSSCSKKEEDVQPESNILVVDDVVVEKPEIMIYVYQVVEEFQRIGGENVWEFEDFSGGKSAVEVAKDAVLENIIRIKVINKKAAELGIVLTQEQQQNARQKAEEYFSSMRAEYIQSHGITSDLMIQVFSEFALSNEVIKNVTSDFTPSQDTVEARMRENEEYNRVKDVDVTLLLTEIDVQHIFIETRTKDSGGNYIADSDAEKAQKYDLAEQIYKEAQNGAAFDELIQNYSDEQATEEELIVGDSIGGSNTKNVGEYVFSKGLLSETPFAALIDLKEGEISSIIEDSTGYHLFKIKSVILPTEDKIETFKADFAEFENELRKSTEKDVISESFEQLYKQWKELTKVTLDTVQWTNISLQN